MPSRASFCGSVLQEVFSTGLAGKKNKGRLWRVLVYNKPHCYCISKAVLFRRCADNSSLNVYLSVGYYLSNLGAICPESGTALRG